jgi:phosphoribosylformylglycinamidine (FGAM) synthase-like enzyme
MGERIGRRGASGTVPLKYAGLSYTEIWISEAQERMVLAVPSTNRQGLGHLVRHEPDRYGDLDPYQHAPSSAIDEALRNCIAVGAEPATHRHSR